MNLYECFRWIDRVSHIFYNSEKTRRDEIDQNDLIIMYSWW
jgi:hypothetical protein